MCIAAAAIPAASTSAICCLHCCLHRYGHHVCSTAGSPSPGPAQHAGQAARAEHADAASVNDAAGRCSNSSSIQNKGSQIQQRQQQDQYNLQVRDPSNQIQNQYNQQRAQVEQREPISRRSTQLTGWLTSAVWRSRTSKSSTTTKQPIRSTSRSNPRSLRPRRKQPSLNRPHWLRQLAQKVQFYLQAGPDSRLVC